MSSTETVLARGNVAVIGVGDAWGGPLDLWDRVIGINLYGVVHRIRAFLSIMTEQGSVLCPGFVKTDLMAKEPAKVSAPIGELMGAMLASGIEDGIPAADVAQRFVAAVGDGQFWILTHDEMRQMSVERMQRAASQTNSPMLGAD